MKITVMTDKAGEVVATVEHPATKTAESPDVTIEAPEGHTIRELDLTAGMSAVKGPDDLEALIRRSIPR